jgi:hypothetical protein
MPARERNKSMMRAISAVFLIFFATLLPAAPAVPAVAQNRTVFGIELGARFNVPQCAPGEGSYPAKPCYTGSGATPEAWGGHDYHVFLPSAGTPAFVRGYLIVSVKDGIVESVHINTWGFEAQQGAMTALKKQFGEPTRVSLKEGRNASRTRNRAQMAEWVFSDFSIMFDGVMGSIDWGQIQVSTHRYTKLMGDYGKRTNSSAPKR